MGLLDDVKFYAAVMESLRRTVVCRPEDEAGVREIIAAYNLGETWTVQVSKATPEGQILVLDTNAIEADHNEAMQRLVRRPL